MQQQEEDCEARHQAGKKGMQPSIVMDSKGRKRFISSQDDRAGPPTPRTERKPRKRIVSMSDSDDDVPIFQNVDFSKWDFAKGQTAPDRVNECVSDDDVPLIGRGKGMTAINLRSGNAKR